MQSMTSAARKIAEGSPVGPVPGSTGQPRAIVCDYARPNTDNPGTFLYLQFAEPADGKPINITSKN